MKDNHGSTYLEYIRCMTDTGTIHYEIQYILICALPHHRGAACNSCDSQLPKTRLRANIQHFKANLTPNLMKKKFKTDNLYQQGTKLHTTVQRLKIISKISWAIR